MNKLNRETFPRDMPMEERWSIGTAIDCHVRVIADEVSPHHCRVLRGGERWWILPLEGKVLINHTAIAGMTEIDPTDHVLLAPGIDLPWPSPNGAKQVLTIGRSEKCDLVLEYANVSARHARMIVGHHGTCVLEDLDSTNGIYVDADRADKVKRLQIDPEMTVYFGVTPVAASILMRPLTSSPGADPVNALDRPAAPGKRASGAKGLPATAGNRGTAVAATASSPLNQPSIQDSSSSAQPQEDLLSRNAPYGPIDPRWGWTVVSGIAVLLIMVGFFVWPQGMDDDAATTLLPRPDVQGDETDPAASMRREREEEKFPRPLEPADTPPPSPSATLSGPEREVKASEEILPKAEDDEHKRDASDAMYWVLVEIPREDASEEKNAFRLGTAVAVAPDRLLTTGSIVLAGKQFAEESAGELRVMHLKSRRITNVSRSVIHPAFSDRMARADLAYERHEEVSSGGADKEIEEEEQNRAVEMVNLALSAVASVDVGCLLVEDAIGSVPIDDGVTRRPRQSVEVWHGGFDADDPFFDPAGKVEIRRLASRIESLAAALERIPGHSRFIVRPERENLNLFGSPVLSGGELVGMVSYSTDADSGSGEAMIEAVAPSVLADVLKISH